MSSKRRISRDHEMKMRGYCRLWWPNHLAVLEPASPIFLFGWFVSSSSTSLDIVVAFACDDVSLSSIQSGLQGILHDTNRSMPESLQDKCTLSMLGYCTVNMSSNGQLPSVGVEEDNQITAPHRNTCTESSRKMSIPKFGSWGCGCHKIDGLLDHFSQVFLEKSIWIQLEYVSHGYSGRRIKWLPKLNHMHCNGQIISSFDLHVVLYNTPTFGSHHFSVGLWSSEKVKPPLNKPKWVEKLHQKQPLLHLDAVVLSTNCAYAAKLLFERHVCPEKETTRLPIIFKCVTLTWKLFSVFIASLSTSFYIFFWSFHIVLSSGSQSWTYFPEKVLCNTLKNFRIRRSQILYWAVLLKDNGLRSQSCVEYAEKAALHKHSMWSGVAIDILAGFLLGVKLFIHAEPTCRWVSNFANDVTNYLLRTGCVWLMGVPAGFKLNTELAEVLGMISLNAIQIWSTLWFFMGSLFIYFVKGLALSAVIFGLSTAAALIIDMFSLATLHVLTLHWLLSHLYSLQIHAIAALWRLFRYHDVSSCCESNLRGNFEPIFAFQNIIIDS